MDDLNQPITASSAVKCSREDGHVEPECQTHQKAKSRYADNRVASEGRQAGSGEKGECPSARSTAATDPVPYTGKEHLDSTRLQTRERKTSSAGQTVFLGNSSLLPGVGETFKISDFHKGRKCGLSLNAKKTGHMADLFLIGWFCRKFFYLFIKVLQLIHQLVIGRKVFCQGFLIEAFRL